VLNYTGVYVAEKMCPKCGKKVGAGSNFCKSCGADLNAKVSQSNYVESEWYFFAYLFEFVSGILIYFAKGQNNKRLAFHSAQSTAIGVAGIVLSVIVFPIGWLISLFAWVVCLYLGFEAYNGNDVEIPYLSKYLSDSIGYKLAKK
jgi:uncharacterized membrane protein